MGIVDMSSYPSRPCKLGRCFKIAFDIFCRDLKEVVSVQ